MMDLFDFALCLLRRHVTDSAHNYAWRGILRQQSGCDFARVAGNATFWKVPFDGGQPVKVREKSSCRLSRDGKWFLCAYRDPVPEALVKLLIVSTETGEISRTIEWPSGAQAVYWSPDGQALDYVAEREGSSNIWRLPLSGGKEQKLTDWHTAASVWHFAWSNDGRQLAITRDTHRSELVLIQNFR